MSGLRCALAGLTTRGRCLLSAGVALVVSSFVLGQDDLLRVAVFLLVLPLVAVVVVLRTRYRLTCTRDLSPSRVAAGSPTGVHLRLDNLSRLPSGVMLMEDALPYALGGRPRFVLDRIEPQGVREVNYSVRADLRGRYRIGPLAVRLTDPFGLCELHRSFSAANTLVVTPPVVPLPSLRIGGDQGGGGQSASARLAAGSNDVTTREYRYGDDLRRVHWRSTARTGELMVRQEEQPRQQRATLLLDTRRGAHRGEGPESSFEHAISALASVGVALARSGHVLSLDTDQARPLLPPGALVSEGELLDALADVQAGSGSQLRTAVERLRGAGGGVVVAALGRLGVEDAEDLARLNGVGSRVALLLDVQTWDPTGPTGGTDAAAAVLRGSGWRVVPLSRGTDLADAWSLAVTQPAQPAGARG